MSRYLAALLLAVSLATPCMAEPSLVPPLRLYEARTIVTGTDLRERPAGLLRCLRDVLVQVSGDPALALDRRLPALVPDVAALLRDLDYVDRMSGIAHHDEQGSSDRPYYLTAGFDPARIDALLARLGEKPWPEPRPTFIPVVFVQGPNSSFQLASDEPAAVDQVAALQGAAERYGLRLSVFDRATLAQGLKATPGSQLLTGYMTWSEADHGWVGTFWNWLAPSASGYWGAKGVSFDEAYRVLVRGAAALASGHADHLSQAAIASQP